MTDMSPAVLSARAEVAFRRERVAATLNAMKLRADPRRIAKQALVDATIKGETAAIAGAQTARQYPGAFAGLVAVAGLFLARHRIAHLLGRNRRPDIPVTAGWNETDLDDLG